VVAWQPLPCDIVAAGRGQRKVEVSAKKKKKGNNQLEVQLREWWHGCHCRVTSSQQAGGSYMSGGVAALPCNICHGRQRAA